MKLNESKLTTLLLCLGVSLASPAYMYGMDGSAMNVVQQSQKIKGTVVDANGEPIIGASVLVKGTSNGAATDLDGNFTLQNVPANAQLLVSYVGYVSQTIPTKGKASFSIILKEDNQALEDVVVVGYGTVKKRDLTGSVSSIESSTITAASNPSAIDALEGKMAGVQIRKNAGRPGGTFSVNVRGLSSINNSNNPLWVIDGIPTSEAINDLNPADIEKIDVLKDASATAIYGSRGANGVIIVTTKTGQKGKLSIQYDGYVGARTVANLPKMMNGDEYFQFRKDLFTQQGKSTDRSNSNFFTDEEWNQIDNHQYTDWVDLVTRTGLQYSNTVTASGGDEKGTFTLSLGQLHEEGTIRDQDYNRYNMHVAINRKIGKIWNVGANSYMTYSSQNIGSYEALRSAFRLIPMTNPYDEEGNLKYHVYRQQSVTNPLMETQEDGEHRQNNTYRAYGNIFLKVEPIKGLSLRTQLSPQFYLKRNGYALGTTTKSSAGKSESTEATYSTETYLGYVWDNQVDFNKDFGEHHIGVNLVQSIQYDRWENSDQSAKGFPFNSLWYNIGAAGLSGTTKNSTNYKQSTLSSFLARVQYGLKDRYLLTVSGRWDGSSRLAPGNKWAFFPSAALAWRLSDEPFMKGASKWLDNLKVRLSYGITGNDAVSIYGTQSAVSSLNYDFGGVVSPAYYKSSLANENLTWEKTYEINLGLDYAFLNSRINGSIDVYQRDAKDLIMKRNLPSTSGWSSIWDNIGWVRNRGVEFALNTVNVQTKKFTWITNIVFDTNHNEIVELYGEKKDDVGNKWFIGHPVNVNYDYEFDGIWQTSEAEEAAKYGQTPGQVKVKDQDHNGVINADDKVILGQKTPKWTGSITNTFNYQDWDFSFYIYTQQGAQLSSSFVSTFMNLSGDMNQYACSYWTPENPSNRYPQPGNSGKYFNSTYYQNVSFVRVGSITLGYSLPRTLTSKLGIKKLRFYATTNNPFTFTDYPGFDPEWGNQNTWGEATGYRTFIFGAKLEF